METLRVLQQVITKAKFSNFEQLVTIVREAGRRLVDAQPKGMLGSQPNLFRVFSRLEHSVGNTVRKVLHHIREEYHAAMRNTQPQQPASFSISKFVLQGQPRKQAVVHQESSEDNGTLKESDPDDPDAFAQGIMPVLVEAIKDVYDDLVTVYDSISKNANNHIHSE